MSNPDLCGPSSDSVARALAAAQIGPARQGRARLSGLTETERRLYHWILRRFATGAPPSGEATRATALELGLDPEAALTALARDDLVHLDNDGQPLVAYPFSARARGHRVLINADAEVQAMCAIDALGIAPMLDLPITIVSHDPISGAEIRVQLRPDDAPSWQPEGASVVAGSASCDGPSFCGCCDVLNFFESAENAERYLREHPEVKGMPITIPVATEAGQVVFGDVLKGN